MRPQPCVQSKKHTSVVTAVTPEHPAFPAQSEALPRVDISVEISGPHDFAVRVSAIRQERHPRPPHPAPNVRDDRETPLMPRRDGASW